MKFEHSIQIAAPRAAVWKVTTEIEHWPDWTPTVQAVERIDEGPFGAGSEAFIKQPAMPRSRWRVTSLQPNERFTWETSMRGMRFIATHELADEDGGTRNTLRLQVTGLPAVLMWPMVWLAARRGLRLENESLKRHCEQKEKRDA